MNLNKYILIVLMMALAVSAAFADDKKAEPNQLFYAANSLYEKKDYAKALEDYLKIADSGKESGELYYNIGNSFLKMGKLGFAILYYERAKNFIPRDSDLKSNLSYALSLAGDSSSVQDSTKNFIIKIIKRPFVDFNLNAIAVSAAVLYFMVIAVLIAFLLSRAFKERFGILFPIFFTLFLLNLAAFAVRYYDEQIVKHGIVIKKIDCKYEPIDTATTYYSLPEGAKVIILKTRLGWRQIERSDGKIAWVSEDSIGEI